MDGHQQHPYPGHQDVPFAGQMQPGQQQQHQNLQQFQGMHYQQHQFAHFHQQQQTMQQPQPMHQQQQMQQQPMQQQQQMQMQQQQQMLIQQHLQFQQYHQMQQRQLQMQQQQPENRVQMPQMQMPQEMQQQYQMRMQMHQQQELQKQQMMHQQQMRMKQEFQQHQQMQQQLMLQNQAQQPNLQQQQMQPQQMMQIQMQLRPEMRQQQVPKSPEMQQQPQMQQMPVQPQVQQMQMHPQQHPAQDHNANHQQMQQQHPQQDQHPMSNRNMLAIADGNGQEGQNAEPQRQEFPWSPATAPPVVPPPQLNNVMQQQHQLTDSDGNDQEVQNAERQRQGFSWPPVPPPQFNNPMMMQQPQPQAQLPGPRSGAQLKRKLPDVITIDDSPPGSLVPVKREVIDRDFLRNGPNTDGNGDLRGQEGQFDFRSQFAQIEQQPGPSSHQQTPAMIASHHPATAHHHHEPQHSQPQAVQDEMLRQEPDLNHYPFDITDGFVHEEIVEADNVEMVAPEEDPRAIIEDLQRQLHDVHAQLAKKDQAIHELLNENMELKSRVPEPRPQSMAIQSPANTLTSGSSIHPSPAMVNAQHAEPFALENVQAARANVPMVYEHARAPQFGMNHEEDFDLFDDTDDTMPALDPIHEEDPDAMEEEIVEEVVERRIVRVKQEVPDEFEDAQVDGCGPLVLEEVVDPSAVLVDRVLEPQNLEFQDFGEAINYWKENFEPTAQKARIERILGQKLGRKHLKKFLFYPKDEQVAPQKKYKVCRNCNHFMPHLFEHMGAYSSWESLGHEQQKKWREAKKVIEEIQREQIRCGLIVLTDEALKNPRRN